MEAMHHVEGNEPFMDNYTYALVWWLFALMLGLSIGLVNVVFHKALHYVEEEFRSIGHSLFKVEEHGVGDVIGYHLYRAAGVVISGYIVGLITTYFVPECAGGGTISVRRES
jgi:H+/Cl- antiporter ClcA